MQQVSENEQAATTAFSRQAAHFDVDDFANPVLRGWRQQVYYHVSRHLKKESRILELNSGTGIDALHFARLGNTVLATDIADGMIQQLNEKVKATGITGISSRQVSFDRLNEIPEQDFDFVFSNFGGLNCIDDLAKVARHLSNKIVPGGFVTWVIMPPVCPWEWLRVLKGKWSEGTRRFRHGGVLANVEGTNVRTHYHSLHDMRRALGNSFKLIRSESLGLVSAPPAAQNFLRRFPALQHILRKIDGLIGTQPPFNRWGDHIIATFQFQGK